jgi:SpoVK/Ycf46/Vps4 family AAA+-type ATPase
MVRPLSLPLSFSSFSLPLSLSLSLSLSFPSLFSPVAYAELIDDSCRLGLVFLIEFNGAQLKAVCVEAGMIALREGATILGHEHFHSGILEVQSKKVNSQFYFA